MAFEFKARVLLELGAELISSDAVAIYELVKNAVDAGSASVRIEVRIGMQHSDYVQLVELLQEYQSQEKRTGESDFAATAFNDAVLDALDPKAMQWSRDAFSKSYGNPKTAAAALVALKKAYVAGSRISVRDSGQGMSQSELVTNYLTVGTPGRLHEKQSRVQSVTGDGSRLHYTKTNERLPLGEKGIGRLSAMRLGHLIRVRTKQAKANTWNKLEMDWRPAFSDFSLNANDPLLDFKPTAVECEAKEVAIQGTTIYVRDLQSDWSLEKINGIAVNDLAKLTDPFASLRANKFIDVVYQGTPVKVPSLDREPLDSCDAIVDARFRYDEDDQPELTVNVNYRKLGREKTDRLIGDHLRACVREEISKKRPKVPKILLDAEVVGRALNHLGPWELKFYWFNRGRLQRDNRELYDTLIRGFLENWGGGFLVYRDGFRVYPYGERSDDWLDLDRKALAGGAFKLNRAQIVGYLRLSSIANPMLLDQTNREGFRDSPDKEALRRLLRYIVIGTTRQFLEEVERAVQPPVDQVVEEVQQRISTSKDIAVASLRSIQASTPNESQNVAKVMHHLEEVSEAWERAKLRISLLDREMDRYIHLAGVGLMLEFIAHELSRVTQDTLKAVAGGKMPPEVVEAQLKTLEKRVRILDELSIPGRQIRRPESVHALVEMLVDFHQAKAGRHKIKFELIPPKEKITWEERLEKGQFLQILDNLLSNSFYWLINRLDASIEGVIRIEVDKSQRQVRVTDNGPGISEDRRERVFDQFDTTKPPREGRGLGLFIARKLAEENNATLSLGAISSDGLLRTFVIAFGKKSTE
jgi:signal transduction histidine kinase